MTRRALAAAAVLVAALARPAAAADPLAEAEAAVARLGAYTCDVAVHETKGSAVQDRVYHVAFRPPHHVELEITAGPGRGSGAVWDGGDTARGHLGGLLRGISQTVSIHDPRATSLRGDTVASGTFAELVARPRRVAGEVTTAVGPAIDGAPTDMVTLRPRDPAADGGITRQVLFLSRATHLPVRRESYEGATLVKTERITDVRSVGVPTSGDANTSLRA